MWDLIVLVPDHCLSFYFCFMYIDEKEKLGFQEGREICKTMIYIQYIFHIIVKFRKPGTDS